MNMQACAHSNLKCQVLVTKHFICRSWKHAQVRAITNVEGFFRALSKAQRPTKPERKREYPGNWRLWLKGRYLEISKIASVPSPTSGPILNVRPNKLVQQNWICLRHSHWTWQEHNIWRMCESAWTQGPLFQMCGHESKLSRDVLGLDTNWTWQTTE